MTDPSLDGCRTTNFAMTKRYWCITDDAIEVTTLERQYHLPAQTTAFVGRQSELSDIAHLLTEPDIRLVTILAPGGMCKTRLGIASGERLASHFRDGVYFIPLARLRSPDDMITTIAEHPFSTSRSET